MEKANALQLRQHMGRIVQRLKDKGEPILIEKDRKPVAVLISLEDYQRRFVDIDADIKRRELIEEIKQAKIRLPKRVSSLDLIRSLREGRI
ncbi:MAG TPA: type II toxin-antitoxin system Phd/YefM family antitoxin [Myxococcota bacterium]|nr:type II toxin-antitoxin system Phd/YefM family antitoxin [Myxococcota bacterium]